MASIAQLFRDIEVAASAADPAIAGASARVREFGEAGAGAARNLSAAVADRGPGDGGAAGGAPPGAPAVSGGPPLPRGFLGPGAPSSGGSPGGSGTGRGGFQRVGSEAPSGAVSGGQSGASAATLSSGFQRVEGALASGLNRLASVPTAGERSISAAVAANTAAIGRLADVIGRSDGGAGFRARAGLGL